jgi:hypothetical protein
MRQRMLSAVAFAACLCASAPAQAQDPYLVVPWGASSGGAALAQDATATGNSGGNQTSFTWTHTVAASANLLVVVLDFNIPNASLTDCTGHNTVSAGASSMTMYASAYSTGNSGEGRDRGVEFYYLLSPPTGSVTITANTPSFVTNCSTLGGAGISTVSASVSYKNALGSGTFGTAGSQVSTTVGGVNSLSASSSTTNTNGVIIAGVAARSTSAVSGGGSQTNIQGALSGSNTYGLITKQAGGTSQTSSASWTTADQGALLAVPINSN